MLITFNSIENFAEACRPVRAKDIHHAGSSSWTGYCSFQDALSKATVGDESYVIEAEKLIARLDVDLPETKACETVRSTYGGRVSLSDWLTGAPTPMRRRKRSQSDIAPLKIVVSTTCHATVTAETMKQRGAAILALLLKVQQIRPVQLFLLAEMHGVRDGWHYQLIRVESQPLAVGVAAFALCHVGFARQLTYSLARHLDRFNGGFPDGRETFRTDKYPAMRRERLGLAEQDIVVATLDQDDPLISDPVAWVKNQLENIASNLGGLC